MALTRVSGNLISSGTVTGTQLATSLSTGGPLTVGGALTAPTITSNVNISGNVKAQTYQETFSNVSIASGNITCNLASATIFKTVVTSAANVIFTSPPPNLTGFSFLIQLSQTGSYALTWPSSIQWPSNTAPTLSTTAGYVDTIALYTIDGGTNYYATSVLGQF
jgi:hypothetical protein